MDTGTSLLVMPSEYLSDFLQVIGAQGEYGEVSLVGVVSLPQEGQGALMVSHRKFLTFSQSTGRRLAGGVV